MKGKLLLGILLICTIISAMVMGYVMTSIESVRIRLSEDSPGGFNYLTQTNHNLQSYIDALHQYRALREQGQDTDIAKKTYLRRFDLVWSGIPIFNVNFTEGSSQQEDMELFISKARRFLDEREKLMLAGHVLNDQEINLLLVESRELKAHLRELSQQFFIHTTSLRDEWVATFHQLYRVFWSFAAVLLVTGGLLVSLLIRSNIRKNALVSEAQEAREKLNDTIDELRSGKREQKSKDSFIAAASHDLRQPLHALGLFLTSLDQHVTDKDGRMALEEAVQCANALNRLFNSLLDLSKLDAGVIQAKMEAFELGPLLVMLRQEFVRKAAEAGIHLEIETSPGIVRTDPLLLSRIIRNLLDNAVLHSGASIIRIECKPVAGAMQVLVRDNGHGIPYDEQSQVFSEYYQLDNPERDRSKGLGLGLSIVKRLADLLYIDVVLESTPGQGTSFSIGIPLGAEQYKPQVPDEREPFVAMPAGAGALVAVIDDDATIRSAMEIMLRNMKLRCISAESASELLESIYQMNEQPELILADYRLRKGQTGDDAIREVRATLNNQISAMIITGDTSPARVADAASSGFEILHKPVDPNELHNRITKMLAHDRRSEVSPSSQAAIS